jgi:hypothetical protein
VAAAVEQHPDLAVGAHHGEHRLAGDVGGPEIPRLDEFAFVRDEQPCTLEYPRLL